MAILFAILTALLVQGIQGGLLIKPNLNPQDRSVVNGNPAVPGEFPSQVSLTFCGASIVNKYYALTAAHCVYDYVWNPLSLSVYSGSIDITGGSIHQVEKIITHHSFDSIYLKNDIAVVKVATPFNIDGIKVKPVILPKRDDIVPDYSPAVAIGWGFTSYYRRDYVSDTLNKVDLVISNLETCKRIYHLAGLYVLDTHICAESEEYGRHGICKGDSGGPLFVNGTMVGIVSWSKDGCVNPGYPNVYTRVSSYINWIEENTKIGADTSKI